MFVNIEGTDGAGKQTQSALLAKEIGALLMSYPRYDKESSFAVKSFLRGNLGTLSEVSPYTASITYAVDRVISYNTEPEWEQYRTGIHMVTDRWVMSNITHQSARLKGEEKEKFIQWVTELEYVHNKLPKPDINIFLDMPVWASEKLCESRINKATGENKKDIIESDIDALNSIYNNAVEIAKRFDAIIIPCTEGKRIRSIEEIHADVMTAVRSRF